MRPFERLAAHRLPPTCSAIRQWLIPNVQLSILRDIAFNPYDILRLIVYDALPVSVLAFNERVEKIFCPAVRLVVVKFHFFNELSPDLSSSIAAG